MHTRKLALLCLFVVAFFGVVQGDYVYDNYKQSFAVAPGLSGVLECVNFPLERFSLLFSYRQVHISGFLDQTIEVYTAPDETELRTVMQDSSLLATHNQVQSISCNSFLFGSSGNCYFTLSYYGEPLYGILPRFHYFLTPPPNTFLGVTVPSGTERTYLHVNIYAVDDTYKCVSLMIIGILLFSFSTSFSRSIFIFRLFWALAGAVASIFTLLVAFIYIGSRTIGRGGLSMTSLVAMTAGSWAFSYYANIIPSYEEILQNHYWMALVCLGGFIGLLYGNTFKLTPMQSGKMSMAMKIVSLFLLYNSTHQTEFSILLCLWVVSGMSSYLMTVIAAKTPILSRFVESGSGSGSAKENEKNKEIMKYRMAPHLLATLSPTKRRSIITRLGDEHLRLIFEDFDTHHQTLSEEELSDEMSS